MDNREKILVCALTLFAERGYDAVGIQEIVDAAGVTKPTLYHYFASKHGLLDAVLKHDFDGLAKNIRDAAFYQGDLTRTLEAVTRACFEYAKLRPAFYRMHLSLHFSPPGSEPNQSVRPYHLEQHRMIEEIFIKAVVQNGNMRGRHTLYAVSFLGIIHSYIGLYLNGFLKLDDELVYRTVHQFMHGILS